MAALTVKLSSTGQLLIPKELREQLHWEAGIELTLVPTGRGIFLQPSVKKAKHNLAEAYAVLIVPQEAQWACQYLTPAKRAEEK